MIKLNDKEFLKRVERARLWGVNDKAMLVKTNREISKIYVAALKSKIGDAAMTINVKGRQPITPGQLRRSLGTWTIRSKGNAVSAGPRAAFLGRRVSPRNDGWFAHIVEQGALPKAFGGKRTNKYTGLFGDTMKQVVPKMKVEQRRLYRARLSQYMK